MSRSKRSQKIRRRHNTASHQKRRTMTRRSTFRPEIGKSATCRWYRLWMRTECAPQQEQMPKQALEAMTNVTPASEVSELKTEKPAGTRCLRSNTFAIAMIPSRNHSWIAITCSKFESEPLFGRTSPHQRGSYSMQIYSGEPYVQGDRHCRLSEKWRNT